MLPGACLGSSRASRCLSPGPGTGASRTGLPSPGPIPPPTPKNPASRSNGHTSHLTAPPLSSQPSLMAATSHPGMRSVQLFSNFFLPGLRTNPRIDLAEAGRSAGLTFKVRLRQAVDHLGHLRMGGHEAPSYTEAPSRLSRATGSSNPITTPGHTFSPPDRFGHG